MSETLPVTWPKIAIEINPVTGKPHLTWTAVEGASGYEIYRSTSRDGRYIRMFTVKSTSYNNTSAKAGTTYFYQIKALCEEPVVSNIAYITCDCAQPQTSIKVDAKSGKPVLTWTAVEGAKEYEVYRSTKRNGTYSRMWTVKGTSYRNTTAEAGTTYYYKIRALCTDSRYGDSAFSKVSYITCDCAAPKVSVTNNPVTDTPILTWDAVAGAEKYEIYRSTHEDGTYMRIWVAGSNSYSVPTTEPGVTYYKVRAICEKSTYGDSADSLPVSVTVK